MARGACVAGTGRPWSLPSSDPSFIIKGVDSRQLAHATGVALPVLLNHMLHYTRGDGGWGIVNKAKWASYVLACPSLYERPIHHHPTDLPDYAVNKAGGMDQHTQLFILFFPLLMFSWPRRWVRPSSSFG